MSSPQQPPVDIVAMRRRALETWDVAIQSAVRHMAVAEQVPDPRVAEIELRFAETYAALASACQKVPGSQF